MWPNAYESSSSFLTKSDRSYFTTGIVSSKVISPDVFLLWTVLAVCLWVCDFLDAGHYLQCWCTGAKEWRIQPRATVFSGTCCIWHWALRMGDHTSVDFVRSFDGRSELTSCAWGSAFYWQKRGVPPLPERRAVLIVGMFLLYYFRVFGEFLLLGYFGVEQISAHTANCRWVEPPCRANIH